MYRVRILHHTVARLALAPGDELHHQTMTAELRALLENVGRDGSRFAEIVDDADELAVVQPATETAVVRGRRSMRATHTSHE